MMLKALGLWAFTALLAACGNTTEIKQDDKVFQAHGETWVYSKNESHKTYLAFDSPQGILGPRHGYQEAHLIRNAAGKSISIPDSLYALQKSGTFKKVECCKYFREQGTLYNFQGRLVFVFDNAREFITDCFIYPAGRPDNELKPKGEQVLGVTLFAEFDPAENVFKTKTFNAGDNYLPFEYRGALLRSGRTDLTDSQRHEFLYVKRKPFMCEGPGPALATPSASPALDINAYQYGATRTIRISVAPAATNSLMHQLQSFSSRNGFKTWRAGAPQTGDVALAIEAQEVLVIAAGDDGGLWRVGLYRKLATSRSTFASEDGVEALLREIRNAIEKIPGVTFP